MRLADPHWVSNHGASDRVHLVIDAEVNDWLRGMFQQAAAATTDSDAAKTMFHH